MWDVVRILIALVVAVLLVRDFHRYDSRRFISPTDATPEGYAEWLGSQLGNQVPISLREHLEAGPAQRLLHVVKAHAERQHDGRGTVTKVVPS